MSYKIFASGDRKIQYKQYNSALQNIFHSYKKCWKKRGGMSYRFYCYLKKFPYAGIEKYNTNNRTLRYKTL